MTTQLTFQGLLDALATVPQDALVKISGFGSADNPGEVFRHRPFVDGLSIIPRFGLQITAADYAAFLRKNGPHKASARHGRNGFIDRHPAGPETPMWAGVAHTVGFNAITGVEMKKGFAVIRTRDLAPVQGPSLQRIPDEEVINRMRAEHLQRTGDDIDLAPAANSYLIHFLPADRTRVLHNLAEAREDLASFEASLQAKKALVGKLELDTARHDYLLGIRDELPGTLA